MRTLYPLAAFAAASFAFPALAQPIEVDHRGITLGENEVTLTLGGRIHVDLATFNEDTSTTFKDDASFRRVRVDATLTVKDDWRFKVDADIGGQSKGIRNLWASYRGIEDVTIKAGNFIAPMAGENMMSSNNIKLMERSLASQLAPISC
jgi:phosphate-selective porin OprO/OprP